MGFIKSMTHRDGIASSKKTWYNGACLTATLILLWIAYKLPTEQGVDDWAFIWLFGSYLLTVGGFDVILEAMKLVIEFKGGKDTFKETKTTTGGTQ